MALVAVIAERLGRRDFSEALRRKGTTWERAQETLGALVPFTLLVDDADKLAKAGKGFDDAFLSCVRGLVEERRLLWVSASDRPLHEVFKEKKLSSDFLNSSEKIWLGPLDEEAALQLVGRAEPELARRMLGEAGHFAHGLQWLGDHFYRNPSAAAAIVDEFRDDMERVFATWCEHLLPRQMELLRRCANGIGGVQGDEQTLLNLLVKRKLVVQRNGKYHLIPGKAWLEFVRGRR